MKGSAPQRVGKEETDVCMRGHDRIRGCDKIQTSIDDQRADGDGSGHCECDSSGLGQCQGMTAIEVLMDLTNIAEPFGA